MASIRYIVASLNDYNFCVSFNKKILKGAGVSDKELKTMLDDPMNAPFEDNERKLLTFVKKGVTNPDSITRSDIDVLMDVGWKESDVLDALYHGAAMSIPGILVKAFSKK